MVKRAMLLLAMTVAALFVASGVALAAVLVAREGRMRSLVRSRTTP